MSDKNTEVQEDTQKAGDDRIYELGYLLLPTISEEDLPSETGKIKGLVDAVSPVTVEEEYPKMIPLAYTIQKRFEDGYKEFSNAYFGWIKFEGTADVIASLKKELDVHSLVLRYIIVKTTRESVVRKQRFSKKPQDLATEVKEEEKEEMDVEAVDKEIESLVT